MAMREYRKGNWTVEETMILIEAKKKDYERRKFSRSKQTHQISTPPTSGGSSTSKPIIELRWKWVEEYCWGKGCFRSQNQCNDKWDNLMRDYKKVRDYQKNLSETETGTGTEPETEGGSGSSSTLNKSYWSMDKVERKDKGLPTNMLPQIYQALFDVVETSTSTSSTPTPTPSSATTAGHFLLPSPVLEMQQTPSSVPALQLSPPQSMLPSPRLPPLLQSPPSSAFFSPQQQPHHPSPTLEIETSQYSHDPESSPAKRRRKEEAIAAATHTAAAEAAAAKATTTTLEEVSTAISRSATMITEAIQASEEREEKRHREMMNIQESRLRIEESELEMNRQGFNGLTEAINRLATSIFTWANSHKNQQGPS
ncbi:flocculation protein FLO11-like [Chenopodium quinoa]|uniref:flocculation protein FLO11-like n=1 Tax=Chenopodium quinoa TaxID=63459 RepID=UPI000B7772F7|nr:flocculation protein FLO11-like [Chenopodium quinoa]